MPDYEPLPGSLNELFRRQQQEATPRTLVPGPNGGLVPHVPGPAAPQPEPNMSTGQIARTLMDVGGTAMSLPRMMAWNAGPAMVGRSGQGPQTGAEALQRIGLDYGSPTQRAIGHGLGRGLDLLADPMNLVGMGAGRAAPAAAGTASEVGGSLARRLERMVAPVAESNAAGRVPVQARIDNWMQGVGHPPIEFAPGAGGPNAWTGAPARGQAARSLAETIPGGGAPATPTTIQRPGQLPFTPPAEFRPIPPQGSYRSPTPAGTPGSVQNFAHDADALRRMQLNSPSFNPADPVFGLGTGQFTQDAGAAARYGLGEYNPLTTSRLLQGAGTAVPAATTPSIIDRLRRLTPQQTPGPNY